MTTWNLDVDAAPISDLVSAFANLAREKGSILRHGAILPDPRPKDVKEKWLAEMRAVVGALRERAQLGDVRPLFYDEDDDVRGMASTALAFFDEELSSAAGGGVVYGASTDEALHWMRRARALDVADPSLDRMTEDQVFHRVLDVFMRLYGTRFFDWLGDDGNGFTEGCTDIVNRNHWVGEEVLALRELKARGALARVSPLMDDSNPVVQAQAATACLALATDKALAILEDRAKGMFGRGTGEAYEIWAAQHALKNWRAGKPVIWGVV